MALQNILMAHQIMIWPIEIVNCGAIVPLMILAFPIPVGIKVRFAHLID
jgi:hypothetical protein